MRLGYTRRRPRLGALLRTVLDIAARPLRRAYYEDMRCQRLVALLPAGWRCRLGLDDDLAAGSRRLEIGSGLRPQPGYIHLDRSGLAPHLERVGDGRHLPYPDGWADEIKAIHVLEHIQPRHLIETLREWRRVLREGGRVVVHVPDCDALMRHFLDGGTAAKWAATGALLGVDSAPPLTGPLDLLYPAQHQILFDGSLLRLAFEEAGYSRALDLSSELSDVHCEAWADVVPQFSLIFAAHR